MSKKYILIGCGVVIFFTITIIGFLFILYIQQKKVISENFQYESNKSSEVSFIDWVTNKRSFNSKDSSIEPTKLTISPEFDPTVSFTSSEKGAENYSMYYVKRGSLTSIDESENRLTIQDHFSPNINLTIDMSNVDDVYCWPSKVRNPDGSIHELQDAFIPFPPFKDLAWTNQTIKKWETVSKNLQPGRYMFVRLAEPYNEPRDNTSVLNVEQVVVLDC